MEKNVCTIALKTPGNVARRAVHDSVAKSGGNVTIVKLTFFLIDGAKL